MLIPSASYGYFREDEMSNANPHTINFTDLDWNTLKELANAEHLSPTQLIGRLCSEYAKAHGKEWRGNNTNGDASRFKKGAK